MGARGGFTLSQPTNLLVATARKRGGPMMQERGESSAAISLCRQERVGLGAELERWPGESREVTGRKSPWGYTGAMTGRCDWTSGGSFLRFPFCP